MIEYLPAKIACAGWETLPGATPVNIVNSSLIIHQARKIVNSYVRMLFNVESICMEFEEMLTTGEATALTGLSASQLTKVCRAGSVVARKRGREWFIQRASLLAYLQAGHPDRFQHLTKPS